MKTLQPKAVLLWTTRLGNIGLREMGPNTLYPTLIRCNLENTEVAINAARNGYVLLPCECRYRQQSPIAMTRCCVVSWLSQDEIRQRRCSSIPAAVFTSPPTLPPPPPFNQKSVI